MIFGHSTVSPLPLWLPAGLVAPADRSSLPRVGGRPIGRGGRSCILRCSCGSAARVGVEVAQEVGDVGYDLLQEVEPRLGGDTALAKMIISFCDHRFLVK